ncbi:hypothetical protein HDU92_000234 [Lobulomyces angularis]|nr:hypothetical protein HDU92_000234 [Lobulomyces angularis]
MNIEEIEKLDIYLEAAKKSISEATENIMLLEPDIKEKSKKKLSLNYLDEIEPEKELKREKIETNNKKKVKESMATKKLDTSGPYLQTNFETGVTTLKNSILSLETNINQNELLMKNIVEAKPVVPPMLQEDPKKIKEKTIETAGAKWFDMPATEITPEIKRDLHILKSRGALDPKRHYKKDNKTGLPKFFQFGTIIEDKADYYSSRLTKKERSESFIGEILQDSEKTEYFKKKFNHVQQKNMKSLPGWLQKKIEHQRRKGKKVMVPHRK